MILPTLDMMLDDGVVLLLLEAHFEEEDLASPNRPRWRTLLGDLARLKAGWRPDDAILSKAPLLTGWSVSESDVFGLVLLRGTVTGHALIPDHRVVNTSPLVALDTRSLRWARTVTQFYRVEQPDRSD